MAAKIEKVSIIISKESLEGIYPGLIMANGARAEGMEANLFFTFFGLDAVHKARHEHIKLATVGNPGLHQGTWASGVPGVLLGHDPPHGPQDGLARHTVHPRVRRDDRRYRRGTVRAKASADLFGPAQSDLIDQVKDIITVGEFMDLAACGEIIFT